MAAETGGTSELIDIAVSLSREGWEKVLASLDAGQIEGLDAALQENKELSDDRLSSIDGKLSQVLSLLKSGGGVGAKGKGARTEKRVAASKPVRSTGLRAEKADKPAKSPKSPSGGHAKRKSRGGGADRPDTDDRKTSYRFGSRNLTVVYPSEGYPDKKEARKKPRATLEMDHVHGFPGHNEHGYRAMAVSSDGQYLVYFIAAVVIVHEVATRKQFFFAHHNDDITAMVMDPREGSTLVASGQKDPKDTPEGGKDLPKIWVFDYLTREPKCLIDNVGYGKVSRVAWSAHTGNLYAIAGDDSQTMKGYDSSTFSMSGSPSELFALGTYKHEIFGMMCMDGAFVNADKFVEEIVLYGKRTFGYGFLSMKKGQYALKCKQVGISKLYKEGEKAFLCAAVLDEGRYAVGGSSGNIYVAKDVSPLFVVKSAHSKAIGSLSWSAATQTLISGGHDKEMKKWQVDGEGKKKKLKEIWNSGEVHIAESDFVFKPKAAAYDGVNHRIFVGTKSNQIIQYEFKEESGELLVDGHDGQIWELASHPTEDLFATGGYDNAIKVWDAPTQKCTTTLELPIPKGKKGQKVVQLAWSNCGKYIAYGTEESQVGLVSWPGLQVLVSYTIPPKTKAGTVEEVSYLRFSEDDKHLAVAHMDSNLYLFDVKEGDDGMELVGWKPLPHSSAAPTHVQWTADGKMIKSFTRDYEIVHWQLNHKTRKGKHYPYTPDPDDTKWAGDPLIAGWDTQGLYQSQLSWDGTDLNDAAVSADAKLIAAGDDYGHVRLHAYPAIDPTAALAYTGHAEFVVGTEFLASDQQVVTCGGADMAVIQWKVIREEEEEKDD